MRIISSTKTLMENILTLEDCIKENTVETPEDQEV